MHKDSLLRALAIAQGLMYVVTGFWPLFSRRTFEKVTGPKHDFWLVNTVGVIVGSIGGVLVSAGMRRRVTPEISALAVNTAAGLTGIDVYYTSQRRISRIYLLDAAIELVLIAGWVFALFTGRKSDWMRKHSAAQRSAAPAKTPQPVMER